MVVVVVEPFRKSLPALLVRVIGACIGPLTEQRLDEALNLPVGLWTIGPDDLIADPELAHCVAEGVAPHVTEVAVGHDPLDMDSL